MKISVTAEHIAKGERDSCTACPVALALIDAGVESPEVNYTRVWYYRDNLPSFLAILPPDVTDKIQLFDDFGVMEPFTFEIDERIVL